MASVAEVEAATWPEQKAPRIQVVLREITWCWGELSLDFLKLLSVQAAQEWLETLPGVGSKTSAVRPRCSSAACANRPCRWTATTTGWPGGWA